MTLEFKHFDTRLKQWIVNENPNNDEPILTEKLDNTLLEVYFPALQFSFGHIDEHSNIKDLYNHPEGHVLLLSSGERLLYGEKDCLETLDKLCPDRKDRGAYGSLFIGDCQNSIYKEMTILVVDDANGKNGGILPDDLAWRLIGDCHGKINPELARELSGSVEHLIQHRLGIPEEFRFAKGTLAPKDLNALPYTNSDTKVDVIIPTSSFKGGDKQNNPIQPGLHKVKVWLGQKALSKQGKIAISELHASFPEGIRDFLKTLEKQAGNLQEVQNDPRKVALRYCQAYEKRKENQLVSDRDREPDNPTENEQDEDLMYRIIKSDLESGHCQLLETQKVTDELKRFLRNEWLNIAIGKSIEFERGMIIPSKDLQNGEIYVSWLNENEEVLNFRSPVLNSNGVCVSVNKFTEDALAPNGKYLKGVIVVNDEDHKRIQERLKTLADRGIETEEIEPLETESERQGRDFDGDCLGVAAASKFPNLTAEVKYRNLPENAYAPVRKEAKASFYREDGSQPPFEEIALFMANSPVGIIANHSKALCSLESEIDILKKYGTNSQKSAYVGKIADHYQDLRASQASGDYVIPERYRERINEICEIASSPTRSAEQIDRVMNLNRSIYHDLIQEAGYENQIAVDMFKSNRVANLVTIKDHKKMLYRIPNFIRDKKNKNVYVDRGIEVHGFSPVELLVRQANSYFVESNLVARPTEQFRDLFPENYSAAQYNTALAKKTEFDKLLGDAAKHNLKFRNERGPVLKVKTASGKELEITNLTKFKHPLAFKADTLDIKLEKNRNSNDYHKLVAFAPDPTDGEYSPLGTVCEISRAEQGLKAGMGTKQAQVKLATPLTERQVQLKFRIAYQMAQKWAESISPESKQALAEAAWHTCTTRQNKGASNKVGNFGFAAFGDEIVGQLEQLQFNKLTIGELKNSEVPIEAWRNKEISIAIKEEEDRRYVYIKDFEGNSKKLGVLSNQQGQMPDCTKATGMVRADFIATATLKVPGLPTPITFGKINEHSFSDRHFTGDPVKVTLQTYQPPEKPILKLDGKEIGELDTRSQKMLREERKLREGTKLEVSLSTLGSGNSLHTLATELGKGNTIKVDRQNFSPHAGTRFSASKANVEIGFKQAKSAMGVWLDTGNGQPELAGIFTPNQKESKEVLMKNLLWRDGATFDAQITSNVSIAQLELKGDTVKYPPLGQWSKPREQVVTQPTAIEGQADTYLQKLKQLPSLLHKLDQDWQIDGKIQTLPTWGLTVDKDVGSLTAEWLKHQGIEFERVPQNDLRVEAETLRGYAVFRMRESSLSPDAQSVLVKHCGKLLDANLVDISTISPYYEKLGQMPLIDREELSLNDDYWQLGGTPAIKDTAIAFNPLLGLSPVSEATAPHMVKDLAMADRATQFIGISSAPDGVPSSTRNYQQAWGNRANTGKYSEADVIMVSGSGPWRGVSEEQIKANFEKHYVPLLDAAIAAGSQILVGNAKGGDRLVQQYLKERGYQDDWDERGYWQMSPGVIEKKASVGESINSSADKLIQFPPTTNEYMNINLQLQQQRTDKIAPVVAGLMEAKRLTEPTAFEVEPETGIVTLTGQENVMKYDSSNKQLFLFDRATKEMKMSAIATGNFEKGEINWISQPLPDGSLGLSEKDVETFGPDLQVAIKKTILEASQKQKQQQNNVQLNTAQSNGHHR